MKFKYLIGFLEEKGNNIFLVNHHLTLPTPAQKEDKIEFKITDIKSSKISKMPGWLKKHKYKKCWEIKEIINSPRRKKTRVVLTPRYKK